MSLEKMPGDIRFSFGKSTNFQTSGDGVLIGNEGADPYAADAKWISGGGQEAAQQLDIQIIQSLETPAVSETPTPPAAPPA